MTNRVQRSILARPFVRSALKDMEVDGNRDRKASNGWGAKSPRRRFGPDPRTNHTGPRREKKPHNRGLTHDRKRSTSSFQKLLAKPGTSTHHPFAFAERSQPFGKGISVRQPDQITEEGKFSCSMQRDQPFKEQPTE